MNSNSNNSNSNNNNNILSRLHSNLTMKGEKKLTQQSHKKVEIKALLTLYVQNWWNISDDQLA
jgi:hypothetical protein